MGRFPAQCGAVAEWSKALAWKVSIRQNRIEGSNPSRSAIHSRVASIGSCTRTQSTSIVISPFLIRFTVAAGKPLYG